MIVTHCGSPRTSSWLAAWVLLALSGQAAAADSNFLERLRAFDVNQYAVGAVVTTSDNVYVGARDSEVIYPMLAQFDPSDFDDGILFGRDGGLGVRFAPPFGLEIGALIKVQGLGFQDEDSSALAGMPDRSWTVEAGPTIGWRRWPVRVDWTTYADLLRRHGGLNHYLRFSLPVRSARGYLVPEIGIRRYSAEFVDFYFGVPAGVATSERPAYQGNVADNPSLAVEWGRRIMRNWFLRGRLGMEWLDSSITGSPIVGDDERAFLSVGLFYDQPAFAPLDAPLGERAPAAPSVRLQLTAAGLDVDTSFAAIAGDDSTVERAATDGRLLYIDGTVRIAGPHRIVAGLFESEHSGRTRNCACLRAAHVGYGIGVLEDRQKDVTLYAGLHLSELGSDSAAPVSERSDGPRPVLGALATLRFRGKWVVGGEARWSLLAHEPYRGRRLFAVASLRRTFGRTSLGLGYVFDRIHLESSAAGVQSELDADYAGPSLAIEGTF